MLYWYLVGLIVKELFLLPYRCGGREGRVVGGKEVKKMLAGINLCWRLSFSWQFFLQACKRAVERTKI